MREVSAARMVAATFGWFLVTYLILWGSGLLSLVIPRDDSDPPKGSHSGLNVYRDALTGCEYLGRLGALTPRLSADGKQVCR